MAELRWRTWGRPSSALCPLFLSIHQRFTTTTSTRGSARYFASEGRAMRATSFAAGLRTAHHRRRHRGDPLHELLHRRQGQYRVLHRPVFAAITGKTPEYGFHLPENRLGKTLFDIKVKLKDETDWSALGYYISRTLGKNYWDVPVINGIDPAEITNDDLVFLLLEHTFLRRGRSFPPRGRLARRDGHWSRPSADASPRRRSLSDPRN